MKTSVNKLKNLMSTIIGCVVLIFAFFFVGMVNNNEKVGALDINNLTYNDSGISFQVSASVAGVKEVGYFICRYNSSGQKVCTTSTQKTIFSGLSCSLGSKHNTVTVSWNASSTTLSASTEEGKSTSFSVSVSTDYHKQGWIFQVATKNCSGDGANSQISIPAWYYLAPEVSVSMDNGNWAKSHTATYSASGYGTVTTYYSWDDMSDNEPERWYYSGCSQRLANTSNSLANLPYTASGGSITKRSVTGTYRLTVCAKDGKGRASSGYYDEGKWYVYAFFDNTAPTFSSYSSTSNTTWAKSRSVTASYSDSHSGLESIHYCWNTSNAVDSYGVQTCDSETSTISGVSGKYYLHTWAEDYLGNYRFASNAGPFYIDNTRPTVSLSKSSQTTWASSISVTLTTSDSHSGPRNTYYCWSTSSSSCNGDGVRPEVSSTTATLSGVTGTYYLFYDAQDNAGNYAYAEYGVAGPYYLDITRPTVSVSPSSNSSYVQSVSVTLTTSDSHSGPRNTYYCWSTSSSSCNGDGVRPEVSSTTATLSGVTGTYYLFYDAQDNAGNYAYAEYGVAGPYYLDNTRPTVSVSPSSNSSYVKGVSVSLNSSDSHSGVYYTYYCWSTSNSSCTGSSSNPNVSSTTATISGVTGTYYLFYDAKDNAGNYAYSSYGVAGPYYLDNTAPTLSSRTSNGNTNWAKSYTVTATYSDAHTSVGAVEYCWNTSSTASTVSSCASTSSTISGVTGYYYLHTRARDTTPKGTASSDYNWSGWSVTKVYYLDNTAPSFSSFDPNGSTTWVQSRNVEITYTDGHSGVKKIYYCWTTSSSGCTPSSGSTSTGTLSISKDSVSGYYYLSTKAEDNAGNVSGVTTSPAFYFDNEDPDNPTYTASDTTWRQSKTVTLTSGDDYSGVDGFYYCTTTSSSGCTPGTWANASSGSASITLSSSGKWYVSAYAIDNAGNTSSTTTSGVYWIDSTAPSLSSINPNGNSTYKKSQSTVVTYTDGHSGVNQIQYCWTTDSSASSCSSPSTMANGGTATQSSGTGYYYLLVRAYDKSTSNNYSGWTRSNAFYLDNTLPSFSSRTPSGETTYTKSKGITVVYSDGHSGVASIKYCWTTSSSGCTPGTVASSNSTSATINKTDGTGTYYLSTLAIDKAGNTSGTTTSTAYYFDNTAPSLSSYSPNGGTWSKSFTVTVTYTDGHSGYGATEYCWNTSSTASTVSSCASTNNSLSGVSGTYYLHTRARDKATKGTGGTTSDYNWSGWSVSSAYYLDNTTPTGPTFSSNGNTTWAKSYTVTSTYADAHSGVGATTYCWNTSSTADSVSSCASSSSTISGVTGYYYLHTRARDKSLTSNAASGSNNYNYTGWSVTGAFYLDNTTPVFSSFSPNGNSSWQKQITVTVTYTDAHSGVKNIQYCWSTTSSCSSYTTVATTTNTISVNSSTIAGIYYLYVKSTDKAGNTSAVTKSNAYYLAVSQELNTSGTHVKYYHSVQLGITGMTSGNTLKVLLNSTECLTVSKTVVFDMNGKTVTCSTASTPTIKNTGTVTIDGSGTVKSTNYYAIENTSSGKVTVKSGTVTATTYGIYNTSTSTSAVTISGGTVQATSNTVKKKYAIYATKGKITVSGGTVQANNTATSVTQDTYMYGIYLSSSSASLSITGGTIKATGACITEEYNLYQYAVYSSSANITMSGGTVQAINTGTTTLEDFASISSYGIYASSSSSFTMSGGTVEAINSIASAGSNYFGDAYAYGVYLSSVTTVKFSGTSNVESSGDALKISTGTITVSGGTYKSNSKVGDALIVGSIWGALSINSCDDETLNEQETIDCYNEKIEEAINESKLTITGGTFVTDRNGISCIRCLMTISNATITINDSDAVLRTGISVSSGRATITNVTITGGTYGIDNDGGEVTIQSGTFSGMDTGTVTFWTSYSSDYYKRTGVTTINGGTITANDEGVINTYSLGTFNAIQAKTIINGGSISGGSYGVENGRGDILIVNGGTITGGTYGIYNYSSSSTDSDTGELFEMVGTVTITAGTIEGGTYGVYNTSSNYSTNNNRGSAQSILNISGGTITGGTYGIYNQASIVTITAGTINGTLYNKSSSTSLDDGTVINHVATITIGVNDSSVSTTSPVVQSTTDVAINAISGTINYHDGVLKGSTSKEYVYKISEGVTYNKGDRSEYTYISGSQYVTALYTAVATIGSTNYNTLQAAFNAGGTITLNKNVTELPLTVASGKTIVLNLNGKILNNFITTAIPTAAGTSNFITNNGTFTVYGGTMQTYRNVAGIHNNGTLNYGRSSDALSTTGPVLNSLGYAINNVEGKTLNYNNGKLISKNQSNVISSQNKDLYIRSGHYMDFSASSPYSVNLVSGSILGSSMSATTSISGTTLTVVVNHTRSIAGTDESVKVWLRSVGTGEYAMSCTSSGTVTTCTTTVTSSFAYLYNATYANELLVAYVDNEGSVVDRREILRRDLLIVPEILGSDNTAGAEVNKNGYSLFSDGKTIMIALNSASLSDVSINEAVILKAVFGDNYATILGSYNVGIGSVDTNTCAGVNGCVGFDTTTMTITASYNSGYPATNSYLLNNQPKIMVYDYTPKFSASSVTALSATTCELGSSCSVTPLSYYDYEGNLVNTVSNIITYNGEEVERIDTTRLGTYLVTTVATDSRGYKSRPVVREYNIVDTTAPTIEVNKEALVVKQGEEINDIDEIVVIDNYDEVLMIERISEEVDTSKAGTYKLGYKVVDSNGNETIVYRDVIVEGDNTKTIMITIMITTLLSTVLGVGTYYFIKRRKSYLN